jgi:hypothetical protein
MLALREEEIEILTSSVNDPKQLPSQLELQDVKKILNKIVLPKSNNKPKVLQIEKKTWKMN